MHTITIQPHLTHLADLNHTLHGKGYAVLSPQDVAIWSGCTLEALNAIGPSWNDLPADEYLKDGGHYRKRRHASFTYANGQLNTVPHRAHWQPTIYNALHGGMSRMFEPVQRTVVETNAWQAVLSAFAKTALDLYASKHPNIEAPLQCIEAHQFRIDTTDGIGRPTPEGAHRDGVDLVGVFLVQRQDIKGGETRVFEAQGRAGERFCLQESWSLLLLDDESVIHESTPIQPVGESGYRDTLVLTSKSGSFQDEQKP